MKAGEPEAPQKTLFMEPLFQLYDKELIKEKCFSGITLFITPL